MTENELYPIEQYIMTNNDCYKANKRRNPSGIQVHSVGCKGTTRDRWRSWNKSGIKKCANAIIDTDGIMQTLDWNVRPWLSGSGSNGNANDWCVGFEICEPSESNDTPEAAAYLYGCVLWLCTELCKDYGIAPDKVKCHSELHKDGVASNHADVTHWWGKKGTSWEQYNMFRLRMDIAKNLGVKLHVDIYDKVFKKGNSGDAVGLIQMRLNELGFDCGRVDCIYGTTTSEAVKAFQKANNLTVDGICGPITVNRLIPKDEPISEPEPVPDPIPPTHDEGVSDEVKRRVMELQDKLNELQLLVNSIMASL